MEPVSGAWHTCLTAAYGMFACRALPDVVRPRERHGGTEAVWPHEDLLEARMGILVLSGAILNGLSLAQRELPASRASSGAPRPGVAPDCPCVGGQQAPADARLQIDAIANSTKQTLALGLRF